MNKVYLHNHHSENSFLRIYFCLLIPFLGFSLYKNGLYLYNMGLINFTQIFKPLFLFVIAFFISAGTSLLFKKEIFGFKLINNLIVSLIVMYNVNYIIFTVLLLICNIVYHLIKFNISSVYMCLISIIMIVQNNWGFENLYEQGKTFHYSFFDLLIGKGIGGIGNTFLLMIIISFVIFMLSFCFKKTIMVSSIITFYLFYLIYAFMNGGVDINVFANPTLLFALVFIAPLLPFSPYSRSGGLVFGILLGIICFASSFWNIELGTYIGISILSISSILFDKLFTKKGSKQLIDVL